MVWFIELSGLLAYGLWCIWQIIVNTQMLVTWSHDYSILNHWVYYTVLVMKVRNIFLLYLS